MRMCKVVTEDSGKVLVFNNDQVFEDWKESVIDEIYSELETAGEEDSVSAEDFFEDMYTVEEAKMIVTLEDL